ncbi:MAG: hypothetical protein Q8N55_03990 [bacterium]|nr:hypothetical protein [bacterium]
MQKLYCYIDESGQDTKGKFFVVRHLLGKYILKKLPKQFCLGVQYFLKILLAAIII